MSDGMLNIWQCHDSYRNANLFDLVLVEYYTLDTYCYIYMRTCLCFRLLLMPESESVFYA